MPRLQPNQSGVTLPYGHRVVALGFMEALAMALKTYQFWLCPGCNKLNHDYDLDLDDGSIGYTCVRTNCNWDGSNEDLLLGRTLDA